MKITREDVLKVAALAYLELSEEEVEKFRGQLDSILTYVEQLNAIDTTNIEPMAQALSGLSVDEGTPLREDVVVRCDVRDAALAGAPDPAPPYFRVPKVIEK